MPISVQEVRLFFVCEFYDTSANFWKVGSSRSWLWFCFFPSVQLCKIHSDSKELSFFLLKLFHCIRLTTIHVIDCLFTIFTLHAHKWFYLSIPLRLQMLITKSSPGREVISSWVDAVWLYKSRGKEGAHEMVAHIWVSLQLPSSDVSKTHQTQSALVESEGMTSYPEDPCFKFLLHHILVLNFWGLEARELCEFN